MGKAAGVMVVAFLLGGGAMTLLSGLVGAHAEAVALTLIGASLVGTGRVMSAPPRQQKLLTKPGEARQGGAAQWPTSR